MLPLHADPRATSRMHAAYVLEAPHDENVHARTACSEYARATACSKDAVASSG